MNTNFQVTDKQFLKYVAKNKGGYVSFMLFSLTLHYLLCQNVYHIQSFIWTLIRPKSYVETIHISESVNAIKSVTDVRMPTDPCKFKQDAQAAGADPPLCNSTIGKI